MSSNAKLAQYPKYSDKWFLDLYFRYGSVEEAIASHDEHLPISPANYHRLVAKSGLIKSAGRHVSLPETLHFFKEKALAPGLPLEKLYRNMHPSFQTSLVTLHRIYEHIERETVRRWGVALVITQSDRSGVLMGTEVGGNTRYKKPGDLSIPMGFRKEDENPRHSIIRLLQQEVSTPLAISGQLIDGSRLVHQLVPNSPRPFMYLDIVDVRVSVYKLHIDSSLSQFFGSYKLTDHHFVSQEALIKKSKELRPGISEIISEYENGSGRYVMTPAVCMADINQELLAYVRSNA